MVINLAYVDLVDVVAIYSDGLARSSDETAHMMNVQEMVVQNCCVYEVPD
jgi:hypothetical protein